MNATARSFSAALLAAVVLGACAGTRHAERAWLKYDVGDILFEDKAPDTEGSRIYRHIIPDPEAYIREQACTVLATLYDSPKDRITPVHRIHYTLEDIDGISAKGGSDGDISIFYSTRHIERSYGEQRDTARLMFETRGVLLHELTHAYQLEPQGIGTYGTNRRGGNYMDGYRTTGYFLVWLRDNKDPDFLRKFNRSALEVVPWSFDGAVKHILGEQYDIDSLWHEYQVAVGDIEE